MFVMPERYIVARPFTHNGTDYAVGEEFGPTEAYQARNLDALVSRKFLIPDPDPHGRKAHFSRPAPISHPSKMRVAMKDAVPPPTSFFIIPNPVQIEEDESVQLVPYFNPAGTSAPVVYSQDPGSETVFTVSPTGLLTGVAPGGGRAYADVEGLPRNQVSVEIKAHNPIGLEPSSTEVAVGATATVNVTMDGAPATEGSYEITNSYTQYATTTNLADVITVTGVAPGQANIRVDLPGTEGQVNQILYVDVTAAAPTLSIDPPVGDCDVMQGQYTIQLTAVYAPPGSGGGVNWFSDNTNIATVDQLTGLVTTTNELGTVNITADDGTLSAVCPVTFHAGLVREGPAPSKEEEPPAQKRRPARRTKK